MKFLLFYVRGSCALLLAAGLAACAPVRLATGDYSETRGPGVIMWEGQELRLASDHTFAYSHWSDDISSGRYGTGTYQLTGNKLRLQFTASPPTVAAVLAQPLAPRPDSLVLAFTVMSQPAMGAGKSTAIPYATIAAHDEQGKIVAAVASDTAGRAVLQVPLAARQISVQSLGFTTWRQDCPTSSTAYRLELPANLGTAYAAGTLKSFRVVRRPPTNMLVLRQGKRQTVFKRETALK